LGLARVTQVGGDDDDDDAGGVAADCDEAMGWSCTKKYQSFVLERKMGVEWSKLW
jgi:hypothetical protein